MKILFLTQWFQPEPIFKGIPFAKALRDRGHEVEVLTGFPNYPGGQIYPGYRIRLWQREVIDGIRVNRVALYPSHDKSAVHRILNYVSFGVSSMVIGPLVVKKPDIIYVYNLVTLGITSLLLELFFQCPVVYDIQDLWPDSVADSGMIRNLFWIKILKPWSNQVYRRASHVVTLSPGMKAELIRRGVPEGRISVLYNWCEEGHMRPVERDPLFAEQLGMAGKFVVMFAGTMGVMQGLDKVLDAAEMILQAEPRIRFVFVGGGVDRGRLERIARERKLTNVVFWERQPVEAMNKILALADVLLVHLKDTPIFRLTIPSKIQAYMASGKPILLAVRGDAAHLVQAAGAGILAQPENPKSIAESVLALFRLPEDERKNMGLTAKGYYEKFMSLEVGVSNFVRIFRQLQYAHRP